MVKPKNLNKNSKRQFLLQQKAMIDKELSEIVETSKEDLEVIYENYAVSLKEHEFAKNTLKVYKRAAIRFIQSLKNEEIVNKDHVINFKEHLLEKYTKEQTINSYITALNRFLFFAELDAYKVEKVKGQGVNTLEHRIYEQEYIRMRNKAKKLGEMDLYFAIRIMGETGVRAEEIKYFNAKSVKDNHVMVHNKGKIRKVPMPGELGRELKRYCRETKLVDEKIVNLSYDQLYQGLKAIAGLCKINKKKVHPHAFRHFFGFSFVNTHSDLKLAQLSDILGHTSVETTRIYTRGTLQDYIKTVEVIR